MNQNKLVSVTINAYNSEKYIAETINSVINQTYKNLQIIVVDDASTDKTAEIVKSFNDSRIELYTLAKNGHISNANNEGYRKVRGEYMVHIDSDDIMMPDLIEKSVGFLEEHQEYGATFCRPVAIDENSNNVVNEYIDTVFKTNAKTQSDYVRLFFDSLNHLLHPGVTMRKSVMEDVGFHDMSLCYLHDFDYWTRLILKYQIYVFDEILIRYRVNTTEGHNSCLDDAKMIAHNTEYVRIIYRMIENCPDELFLQAFSDRLILKGEHTPEEIKLEKAFLLRDAFVAISSPENKLLSTIMFSKLFADKKYVDLARDKFNFTVRDFYKQQATPSLYDQNKIEQLDDKISSLQENVDYLYSHIEELRADIKKKGEDLAYYLDLVNYKDSLIDQKQAEIDAKEAVINYKQYEVDAKEAIIQQNRAEIDNLIAEVNNMHSIIAHKQSLLNKTVEYNVARLFKKAFNLLKHIKHFYSLRDKNGKKYRKSVMLYGYYAINLGDDMFFEKLVSRYPDTMFFVYSVYFCKEYREFFERFDNVKFYSTEDALVQKINNIGNKLKIKDLFEVLLLKRSKASVHIGGSIYQEIGDYKLDFKVRLRRKQPFRPFFSISCNFGGYKTEIFKKMWTGQFKKFKDICFRDRYSYELFSKMKNVRYAPDILFSCKNNETQELKGSVAISVFNPFAPHRNIPEQMSNNYLDALVKTVCDLVNGGKQVTLLGFCAFEGDGVLLHELLCKLPDGMREKISAINYSFDTKDQILNAISTAEYVIGTRLHSVILGLVYGKKVLPIAYDQKIKYILKDINYNQEIVDFEHIVDYKETGFADMLNTVKAFDVSALNNADDLQFEELDKFLRR